MNGIAALAVQFRLKDELWDLHTNCALYSNLAAIWERVGLVKLAAALCGGELSIVVLRYKAELLLDILYRGELSAGGERMAALV